MEPRYSSVMQGLLHGWSFSDKVGGTKWLIDGMLCYAKV